MNIHFLTEKTYQLHPLSPKHYTHSYGDVLWYNDVFDVQNFERMPGDQQKIFIWRRAYEILVNASKSSKNDKLLEASGHAYNSGIEIKLNPDYKMIEAEVVLHGNLMSAAVWVNFCDDGMYSKLTLEKDGITFFEKSIDKATNSVEFFLEMYKKIEVKGNDIIVKGHRDVDYLPLKINIAPDGLWKLSSK